MRILLVEDERIVAMALKHQLAGTGYNIVATAANGADALSALQTCKPDLVLMDVMIEGDIDGIETARSMARVSSVPIFYLTGESDPETQRRAMHSPNCRGYMLKPVNPSVLNAHLAAFSKDKPAAQITLA